MGRWRRRWLLPGLVCIALGAVIILGMILPKAMQISPGRLHLRRPLPIKTTAFDRMLFHPMPEAVVLC